MESESSSIADADLHDLLQNVLGAVAAIAGGFLLVALLSSMLFGLTGAESLEALQEDPLRYTVVNGVASAGFIVAAVGFLALRDDWEILHVRRTAATDVGVVVGGVVLLGVANFGMTTLISVVIAALESLFGISVEFGQNTVITTGRRNPSMFLYMIPVTLFIVGPGEELLFRGVVQGLLRRVMGVVPAILAASLLFGLGHYFSVSTGNAWTYLLAAAVMGIVLGGIYEYTENIAVPAAIHGIWNAFLFAVNWGVAVYDVPIPT